jgi:DNA-damage-inducible protein J
MANDTVQARVPHELKQEAEAIFSAIGLKTSDAIRMFLQQSVNSGGLPFQPTARKPNAQTLEAMKEADSPENLPAYGSFADLRKELDV